MGYEACSDVNADNELNVLEEAITKSIRKRTGFDQERIEGIISQLVNNIRKTRVKNFI